MEELKTKQLKRAKELEEQKAIEKAKEFEELKAANESLIEHNEELLSNCHDMEQHLSEVTKAKHKVAGQLQLLLTQRVLSEATLKGDHKNVKYFTGLLSLSVLSSIYNLTVKGLPKPADCSLFDQYLLTLVMLRLNTGDVDLAFRFGISQTTVSRYIHKWVDTLYNRWKFLIHWPECPDLMKTMPSDF